MIYIRKLKVESGIMNKNKSKGEIATLLTIGAFLVIGVSSLVSSLFLKNSQPTTSRAQDVMSTSPVGACPTGITEGADCTGRIPDEYCVICDQTYKCCPPYTGFYRDFAYQCKNNKWTLATPVGECRNDRCQVSDTAGPVGTQPSTSNTQGTVPAPSANGCFTLTDEIYYNGNNLFTHWVKLHEITPGIGDGHVYIGGRYLDVWNRAFLNSRQPLEQNTYVINPDVAGNSNLKAGSNTFDVSIDNCNGATVHNTITCNTNIDADGKPSVSGAGCIPKNFTSVSGPGTATPTPTGSNQSLGLRGTTSLSCQIVGNITLNKGDYGNIKILVRSHSNSLRFKTEKYTDLGKITEENFSNDIEDFIYDSSVVYTYSNNTKLTDSDYKFYVVVDQNGEQLEINSPIDCTSGSNTFNIPVNASFIKPKTPYQLAPKPTSTPTPTPTPTTAPLPNEKTVKLDLQMKNSCGLKYFAGTINSITNPDFTISPRTFSSSNGSFSLTNTLLTINNKITINNKVNNPKNTKFTLSIKGGFATDASSTVTNWADVQFKDLDYSTLKDDSLLQGDVDVDCTGITPGASAVPTLPAGVTIKGDTLVEITIDPSFSGGDIKLNGKQRINWVNHMPTGNGQPERVKIFMPDNPNVHTYSVDYQASQLTTEIITKDTTYRVEVCNLGWFGVWSPCKTFATGTFIVPK